MTLASSLYSSSDTGHDALCLPPSSLESSCEETFQVTKLRDLQAVESRIIGYVERFVQNAERMSSSAQRQLLVSIQIEMRGVLRQILNNETERRRFETAYMELKCKVENERRRWDHRAQELINLQEEMVTTKADHEREVVGLRSLLDAERERARGLVREVTELRSRDTQRKQALRQEVERVVLSWEDDWMHREREVREAMEKDFKQRLARERQSWVEHADVEREVVRREMEERHRAELQLHDDRACMNLRKSLEQQEQQLEKAHQDSLCDMQRQIHNQIETLKAECDALKAKVNRRDAKLVCLKTVVTELQRELLDADQLYMRAGRSHRHKHRSPETNERQRYMHTCSVDENVRSPHHVQRNHEKSKGGPCVRKRGHRSMKSLHESEHRKEVAGLLDAYLSNKAR